MEAKRHQMFQEQVYRMYVGEALKNVSENIANGFGREGATYMAKSFVEIIRPTKVSDESADEIIDRIKRKLKEYE